MAPSTRPQSPHARVLPLVAFVVVFALCLTVTGATAAAPEVPDWEQDNRQVSARSDGAGIALHSARESAAGKDTLQANYDARAATLAFSLEAVEPAAATLATSMAFLAVSEFRDDDRDGRLGPGDPILRRVPIAGTPFVASVQPVGVGGWQATATHTLPPDPATLSDGGQFRVTIRAFPDRRGDATPSPATVSLETVILGAAVANGTHLALEVSFDSTRDPTALNGDLATIEAHGYRLAVRWLDPGAGDVVEGGRTHATYFVRSAPVSDHVEHSASLAASRPSAQSHSMLPDLPHGSLLAYGAAAAVCVILLVLPLVRRARPGP